MAMDQKKQNIAASNLLQSARGIITGAVSFLQSANAVTSATENSTGFDTALQDAIFEIDTQPDLVNPYLDSTIDTLGIVSPDSGVASAEVGQAFTLGSLQMPRKQGRLQRVRNLKVAMFGGTVTVVEDGVTKTSTIEGALGPLKRVSEAAEAKDAS